MSRDLIAEVKIVNAQVPLSITATQNGANVDAVGFSEAVFVIQTGVGATATVQPKIQEADDDGTGAPGAFADCNPSIVFGAAFGQNLVRTMRVKFDTPRKRWLRVVLTYGGSGAIVVSALCALYGSKQLQPDVAPHVVG